MIKKILKIGLLLFFVTLFFIARAQQSDKKTFYDFPRRNSIYVQNLTFYPTIYYDRVIPFGNHFGIIPKFGVVFGMGYGMAVTVEPSVFFGGNKHYGEIGFGRWIGTWAYTLNYRYMGERGLLLKMGFAGGGIDPFPLVGIGYSF